MNLFRPLPNLKAALAAATLACLAAGVVTGCGPDQSALTKSMGITQKLGQPVTKDVVLQDESGKTVRFGDYLGKRPVMVLPISINCEQYCAVITDSLLKTLAQAERHNEMVPGRDFDVVMLSLRAKDTPQIARHKKDLIEQTLTAPGVEKGFHILTGDYASVHRLADSFGFKYTYNAQKDLLNQPVGSVMLTDDGRVSSYMIGTDLPTKVLLTDLDLAGHNRIGEPADESQMYGCIMLDPSSQKYRPLVNLLVRIGGALTFVILAGSIISMSVKYRRSPLNNSGGNSGA